MDVKCCLRVWGKFDRVGGLSARLRGVRKLEGMIGMGVGGCELGVGVWAAGVLFMRFWLIIILWCIVSMEKRSMEVLFLCVSRSGEYTKLVICVGISAHMGHDGVWYDLSSAKCVVRQLG